MPASRQARQLLAKRQVVVSTGATAEPIDMLRVITNRSSGRMGIAVAEAARDAGAKVCLVAAHIQVPLPSGMDRIVRAKSSTAMLRALMRECKGADAFISVAAISDFRPKKRLSGKIPRSGELALALVACPDIIAQVAAMERPPYCVAFSAEAAGMEGAVKRARKKMRAKNVPAIIASPIAQNVEKTSCELTFLTKNSRIDIGKSSKRSAADKIVALLSRRLPS